MRLYGRIFSIGAKLVPNMCILNFVNFLLIIDLLFGCCHYSLLLSSTPTDMQIGRSDKGEKRRRKKDRYRINVRISKPLEEALSIYFPIFT